MLFILIVFAYIIIFSIFRFYLSRNSVVVNTREFRKAIDFFDLAQMYADRDTLYITDQGVCVIIPCKGKFSRFVDFIRIKPFLKDENCANALITRNFIFSGLRLKRIRSCKETYKGPTIADLFTEYSLSFNELEVMVESNQSIYFLDGNFYFGVPFAEKMGFCLSTDLLSRAYNYAQNIPGCTISAAFSRSRVILGVNNVLFYETPRERAEIIDVRTETRIVLPDNLKNIKVDSNIVIKNSEVFMGNTKAGSVVGMNDMQIHISDLDAFKYFLGTEFLPELFIFNDSVAGIKFGRFTIGCAYKRN